VRLATRSGKSFTAGFGIGWKISLSPSPHGEVEGLGPADDVRFTPKVMVGSVGMMFCGLPMVLGCFFRHEYDLLF
jgi:hypothetical protein